MLDDEGFRTIIEPFRIKVVEPIRFTTRAEREAALEAAARQRIEVETARIGDRPAATVDSSSLVRSARDALQEHGITAATSAGSTDANAALAAGIPSICLGVYRGGDAHRLSEWVEPNSLAEGYAVLVSFLNRLAGLRA